MAVDFTSLRQTVADRLGLGRNSAHWTSDDNARLTEIVNQGYRLFIGGSGHDWSFLTPIQSLPLVANQWEYDAPSDFGWLAGEATYAHADNSCWTVRIIGEAQLRVLRQYRDESGRPQVIAVRPVSPAAGPPGAQQTFKLQFWPTPNAVYTVTYAYGVAVTDLSEANPYPFGGTLFPDVIEQACYAIIERRWEGVEGVENQLFREKLAAAIARDRRSRPDWHLGGADWASFLFTRRCPTIQFTGV